MIYTLVNKETGESTEHQTLQAASKSIGRGVCYISQTIRNGYAIRDAEGYEYTIYKDGVVLEYSRSLPKRTAHKHMQICFSCTKAVCGCSWSRWFKPIEGWDAVPSEIKNVAGNTVRITPSYAIRGCPEYEKE